MSCRVRVVLLSIPMFISGSAVTQRTATAFRGVTVIPMDTQRTLPDATVVVEGDKIVRLGPASSTPIPGGARVIEGRGKFLIPGLVDMHTHIDREEEMPLFLAAGVTTTLNMGLASPGFVTETRRAIGRGDVPGPEVFAAFLIDGPGDPGPEYVPACPPDARAAVDRAKLVGYDFIKVYDRLQPDVYAAVLDEAKRQRIAVVGHIPPSVGLQNALSSGQVMIAHGEEYYKTFFGNEADESRITRAVELTKQAGAYVTPNLSFLAALTERVAHPESIDLQLARPESKLVPPEVRGAWASGRQNRPSDRFVPELGLIRKLTLAMSNAGVALLAGTDTPGGGMVPGYSLDDDLEQLVQAGLTPYQALAAATRTPGEFIRKYVPGAEPFGTIAEGQRADLVLLEKNPLEAIANVRNPLAVMAAGHWHTSAELKALVDKPVAGYQRTQRTVDEFQRNVTTQGAEVAIQEYRASKDAPKLTETFVNSLGYELIAQKKLEDAIRVLSLNTELYPESWNAYDSLGEAYLDAGKVDLAVVNYRHSLALNGHNAGAQRVLDKTTTAKPTD